MTPFSLLERLYGDGTTAEIFGESETIESWLAVERALAQAQGEMGIIPAEYADQIVTAATAQSIDPQRLWAEARNVGYPILPLVRMIAECLADGPDGCVHLGATTQDIMDTGLVLQMRRALQRLAELTQAFGSGLAQLVRTHRGTVMAARTHGQQAVPTTFGAKMAIFLQQAIEVLDLIQRARDKINALALHGAAGTSAALGPRSDLLRQHVAAILGLRSIETPWHASRDIIWEFCQPYLRAVATTGRLAREVADLARTEIAEVAEVGGHHRGASSTMPQKENPILAEATLGFAIAATAAGSAIPRIMEVVHERAAGEWQAEWSTVSRVAYLGASAMSTAVELISGLRVHADTMTANIQRDHGLLMAEAYMIHLAPTLGREAAHGLVYEAATEARATNTELFETLAKIAASQQVLLPPQPLAAEDYLGQARTISDDSVAAWSARARRTEDER